MLPSLYYTRTNRRLCRIEINQILIDKSHLLRCKLHVVTSFYTFLRKQALPRFLDTPLCHLEILRIKFYSDKSPPFLQASNTC